jgi:guanyl-specific ribonuclease Sa
MRQCAPLSRKSPSNAPSRAVWGGQMMDTLEGRWLFSFSNWSAIGPAIAKVPTGAGAIASTSVINFGTTVYTGPLNVKNTLDRIRANNGPNRSNDGAAYGNSGGQLPSGHGTWYEFTVPPSGGTDRSFSGVAFPGPMRILLAADGDTFFTGDHYVTFNLVYDPSAAVPVIGSFAVSPTSVVSGANVTFTAANVSETGGTISSVKFYRETNGTSGFQTSDTLVGSGTQSGTTWSLTAATTGLAAGSYGYYAVATDSKAVSSAASSASLAVTAAGVPVIGAFAVSPTAVVTGTSVSLTASNVTETGGTISSVKFYRETNGTSGFQTSDTLLGTGTQSGTTWSLATATTGFAAGTYSYYAVATDTNAVSGAASTATLTVAASATPVIGSFTVSPASVVLGSSFTLTASGVTEVGGTVNSVKFYRETNGTAGYQTTDTLVGNGSQVGTTWAITASSAGLTVGSYTLYAVATDTALVSSAASVATLSVTTAVTTGTLLAWNVNGQTNFGTQGLAATTVASGLTGSLGLTRGSGLQTTQTAAGNAWGANNWNLTSSGGVSGNQSVTFGLTVSSGFVASLSAVDLNYRHSSTGATSGYWQYQLNGGSWNLIGDFANQFPSSASGGAAMTELNLSGIAALSNLAPGTAVNLRLVPYGASASGGTWYVYDLTGDDLVVKGSVSPQAATLPAWVASGSDCTWNASTHVLNVTGLTTIIADPGADAAVVNAATPSAQLRINPFSATVIRLAGLNLSGGASGDIVSLGAARTAVNHVVVVVPGSGLSVDSSSDLNLEDNDMIVTSTTPTAGTATLTAVSGLVGSGQNGTTLFTGNGITSSVAADDADGQLRYAVGVARNLYAGSPLFDTFDGVSVGTNDVLVKFTYFGDADLNGIVDDTDYFLINTGYLGGLSGWVNGDFDYSAAVDDTDYFLLNTAFLSQGTALRANGSGSAGHGDRLWDSRVAGVESVMKELSRA